MKSKTETSQDDRSSQHERECQTKEKADKAKGPPISNYWRILMHSTPWERFLLLVATTASVGSGIPLPLMNIIFGRLVGNFTDYFNPSASVSESEFRGSVASNALIFVYLFIGKFVLTYISTLCFKIAALRISASLRLYYLTQLFQQPVKRLDLVSSGTIASTITTSSNTIQLSIGDQINYLVTSIALVIAAYVVAFIYSWQLALATSSGLVFLLVWFGLTAPPVLKTMKALETADARHTTVASEAISNLRTVLALGAEQKVITNHTRFVQDSKDASHKLAYFIGSQIAPSYFATYCCYALSFWFGLKLLREGHIDSVSQVVIVFFSVLLVTTVLGTIVRPMIAIQQAVAASEPFFEMIDAEPVRSQGLKAPEISADHDINFANVHFSYPSRENVEILKDLSLTFERGKTTAIVGPSGSGKSTVVALIERWYDLDSQQIDSPLEKVDGLSSGGNPSNASGKSNTGVVSIGVDIGQMDLKYLRSQIGLVQQEPFLFDDSVEVNVGYGLIGTQWETAAADVKSRLVREACVKAFADDFISKLPKGYATRVGEGGIQLSGGQRQRIAIARSIIKEPAILILDEATAAIDVRSERIVQKALDNAARGRTTIVIAHRLSTIRKADKIIVLRAGRKVEEGTHSELLSNVNGLYSALVNSQQIQEQDGKDDPESGEELELTQTESKASTGANNTKSSKDIETADYSESTQIYKQRGLTRSVGILLHEQRRWVLYCMITVSAMACGAAYSLSAWLFAKLITTFNLEGQQLIDAGNFWALMFFILAIAVSIAYMALGTFAGFNQAYTGFYIRTTYFQDTLAMPITYYDREENASGSVTSRLSTDPKMIQELLGLNGALPLVGSFNIIGSIIIAFVFGWKLSLVCTFAILPAILLCGFVKLRQEIMSNERNAVIFQTSSRFAVEAAGAHRTVSSLCLEDQISAKYKSLLDAQINESTRRFSYAMIVYSLCDSLELPGIALAFWYGGQLLATRELDALAFFVVYSAIVIGAQQAGQFLSIAPNAAKATASANQILDLREQAKALNPKAKQPNPFRTELGARIEFQNVGFSYESNSQNALFSHLNMMIEPGQFCGLVGTSGCGKSTLISLLERFYEPTSGAILFDGTAISNIDVHEYRKNIALVSQEPRLFSGTIRENLILGVDDPVQDEQIHQACRDAEIHDFIVSLPEGYQTEIGASTSTALSGGQKQRMCLARALLRKPSLLLLDEATSSLDSQSERLVQGAIERLTKERSMTVIAVAHRLATIQQADMIFVLGERDTETRSGSKILEKGSHAELLAKRGVYAGMCRAQALDQ